MTNWDVAVALLIEDERKAIELTLRCIRCGETNLPNIIMVELRDDGCAYCNVCSKSFVPDLSMK